MADIAQEVLHYRPQPALALGEPGSGTVNVLNFKPVQDHYDNYVKTRVAQQKAIIDQHNKNLFRSQLILAKDQDLNFSKVDPKDVDGFRKKADNIATEIAMDDNPQEHMIEYSRAIDDLKAQMNVNAQKWDIYTKDKRTLQTNPGKFAPNSETELEDWRNKDDEDAVKDPYTINPYIHYNAAAVFPYLAKKKLIAPDVVTNLTQMANGTKELTPQTSYNLKQIGAQMDRIWEGDDKIDGNTGIQESVIPAFNDLRNSDPNGDQSVLIGFSALTDDVKKSIAKQDGLTPEQVGKLTDGHPLTVDDIQFLTPEQRAKYIVDTPYKYYMATALAYTPAPVQGKSTLWTDRVAADDAKKTDETNKSSIKTVYDNVTDSLFNPQYIGDPVTNSKGQVEGFVSKAGLDVSGLTIEGSGNKILHPKHVLIKQSITDPNKTTYVLDYGSSAGLGDNSRFHEISPTEMALYLAKKEGISNKYVTEFLQQVNNSQDATYNATNYGKYSGKKLTYNAPVGLNQTDFNQGISGVGSYPKSKYKAVEYGKEPATTPAKSTPLPTDKTGKIDFKSLKNGEIYTYKGKEVIFDGTKFVDATPSK